MRVVLASTVTGRGGVWRHITDVADGMQARGCEVDLALPADALALRREAANTSLRANGNLSRFYGKINKLAAFIPWP